MPYKEQQNIRVLSPTKKMINGVASKDFHKIQKLKEFMAKQQASDAAHQPVKKTSSDGAIQPRVGAGRGSGRGSFSSNTSGGGNAARPASSGPTVSKDIISSAGRGFNKTGNSPGRGRGGHVSAGRGFSNAPGSKSKEGVIKGSSNGLGEQKGSSAVKDEKPAALLTSKSDEKPARKMDGKNRENPSATKSAPQKGSLLDGKASATNPASSDSNSQSSDKQAPLIPDNAMFNPFMPQPGMPPITDFAWFQHMQYVFSRQGLPFPPPLLNLPMNNGMGILGDPFGKGDQKETGSEESDGKLEFRNRGRGYSKGPTNPPGGLSNPPSSAPPKKDNAEHAKSLDFIKDFFKNDPEVQYQRAKSKAAGPRVAPVMGVHMAKQMRKNPGAVAPPKAVNKEYLEGGGLGHIDISSAQGTNVFNSNGESLSEIPVHSMPNRILQHDSSRIIGPVLDTNRVIGSSFDGSRVIGPAQDTSRLMGHALSPHGEPSQLSPNQFSASQLPANQVSASQLSASQLPSSQLSASQLSPGQLSASQLSASQLSANQLPTSQIPTGELSDKMAALQMHGYGHGMNPLGSVDGHGMNPLGSVDAMYMSQDQSNLKHSNAMFPRHWHQTGVGEFDSVDAFQTRSLVDQSSVQWYS